MITRTLEAANSESLVYNKACKVKDGKCLLTDSIIVWDRNMKDKCPYTQLFEKTEYKVSQGLLIS